MSVAALLVAAGRGERLGGPVPKAFVGLAGVPLVLRAADALARADEVERIVPVLPTGEEERWRQLLPRASAAARARLMAPVAGGATRQASVAAGLAVLPADTGWVAVHDAARCLVHAEDVRRVIREARRTGAAILARPVRDTVKRVREGRIVDTPPRAECYAAETPQVFPVPVLREALAKARAEGFEGTDDAQLVERLGMEVHVVEGRPGNLKITHPEDLAAAEARLATSGPRAEA